MWLEKGKNRAERDTQVLDPAWAPGGSVFPNWDVVPEERVAGGSDGLSLLGRKRGQEALEFVGEESGWGRALGLLPEIEVLEDVSNHAALFDHRDDPELGVTLRTFQGVDFIHLAEQPRPAASPLLGEVLSRRVLLRVRRRGGTADSGPGGG